MSTATAKSRAEPDWNAGPIVTAPIAILFDAVSFFFRRWR